MRSNGSPVSRAELGAHLERIDSALESLHEKVDHIAERLDSRSLWWQARLAAVIDRAAIAGLAALVVWLGLS